MQTVTKRKVRTIHASTADEFDFLFNEACDEIDGEVEMKWDTTPMCVHLLYKEQVQIPDTLEDEFKLRDEHYYCKDCPFFHRGKNKRCKSVGCKYSPYGTAAEFNPACEYFYKQLINGKIEPVED